SGGTMLRGADPRPRVSASLIAAALAFGNSDHRSAAAPVTNGAAMLVPDVETSAPSGSRQVTPSPGAERPQRPIEAPRLDIPSTRPPRSQATTGITQGCLVTALLPTVP